MANKENAIPITIAAPSNMRITRAMKRAAEAEAAAAPAAKKRVVLAELSTKPGSNVERVVQGKCQAKTKTKVDAAVVPEVVEDENEDRDLDDRVDELEIAGCYISDILRYLNLMETKPERRPLPNYIETVQNDMSADMRGILVDWLVDVAAEYNMTSSTLFLTVSYVDRFLSVNAVSRHKLQLVGVSAMFIASKYEEITPPHVEDFCYITDNHYRKEEVVKMEADILKALNFDLGNPTIRTFLSRLSAVLQESITDTNEQLEFLCFYLAELSLLDYNCVKFLPSVVAASVIFLARFIIQPKVHPWTEVLQDYTSYKPAYLRECVLLIHDLYLSRRGATLLAIRQKYELRQFKHVATIPSPPSVPAFCFNDIII